MSRVLDLREAGRIAADMLADPGQPRTTSDMDAAITHHGRVLDELTVILRSGAQLDPPTASETQGGPPPGPPQPAQALLQALARHPRAQSSAAVAPSQLLGRRAADGVEGAGGWRHLNRVLVVAAHDWSQVTGRIPNDVQRGVIADVAALTDAVALMQQDLADNLLARGNREEDARRLQYMVPELQTRARAALQQAQLAPRRDGWSPSLSTTPRIIPIVGASQIPEAVSLLARMLHDRELRLDASSAMELIVTHAMTSSLVGAFLQSRGHESAGRALSNHGEHLLHGTGELSGRVWSRVRHPHEHPLAQARELHHAAGRALRPGSIASEHPLVRIALDYAATAPAVSSGLIRQVTSSARRQDWTFLDGRDWQPAESRHLTRLTRALQQGHEDIAQLGPQSIRPSTTATVEGRMAHQLLASARAKHVVTRTPPPPVAAAAQARPRRSR